MDSSTNSAIDKPTTQRLFFALWPDARVRGQLDTAAEAVSRRNGRRVHVDKLHMTLVFLGDTDAQRRDCLCAAAGAIHSPPFTLTLERFGHFRRARVAWLAPCETPPALIALHAAINGILPDCGAEPETRPFRAHVTLARKAARRIVPKDFAPIAWPVREFCLVESVADPDGAHYRVLKTWPLTAPD